MALLEDFTVARRDGDAPFVIHDVVKAPPEQCGPLSPNFLHIKPLSPTWNENTVNLAGSQENYQLVKKNLCPLFKIFLIILIIILSCHNIGELLMISYHMNIINVIKKTTRLARLPCPRCRARVGQARDGCNPWYLNHKDKRAAPRPMWGPRAFRTPPQDFNAHLLTGLASSWVLPGPGRFRKITVWTTL